MVKYLEMLAYFVYSIASIISNYDFLLFFRLAYGRLITSAVYPMVDFHELGRIH
jgi:hypothetical protein